MASIDKSTFLSLIACGAVFSLFLLLSGLQNGVASQLLALSTDPYLIDSVPTCFLRCIVFLSLGSAGFFCFLLWDMKRPLYQNWASARITLFYATLAFFFSYLIMTRCLQFPFCVDDSYIDFRYVFNWVNGISFDYNPDSKERVMGFTSHLHIAILSLLLFLFKNVDLTIISQTVNTVLGMISFFLVFFLLRDLPYSVSSSSTNSAKPYVACGGAVIYALFPYNTIETMAGKETLIVSTLLLLALLSMRKKNVHGVAWCSALLLLTRPEGGLWMLLTMAWSWMVLKGTRAPALAGSTYEEQGSSRHAKRAFLAVWLGPMALCAIVALWLFQSFGTLIPHSLIGKSNMFYKPFPMMDMVLVLRRLADGAFVPEFNFWIDRPWSDVYDFFRLYGGTVLLMAMVKFVREPVLRFYVWAVIAYFLLYSIANPYLFPWYYCWFSLVPPLMIPLLLDKLLRFTGKTRLKAQKFLALLFAAYLVLVQVVEQPLRFTTGLPALSFYWSGAFDRLLIYKKAAEYIRALPSNKAKKAVLASPEVGVLGWYYSGPILDLGGLVCDKVIRYAPPSPEFRKGTSLFAIIPKLIDDMKPDFIVTDASFCENGLYKAPFFKQTYQEDKFYPIELWSNGFYVYRRKEFGVTAAGCKDSVVQLRVP